MPTWDRITALPTALQGNDYPMVLCRDGATLYLLGEEVLSTTTPYLWTVSGTQYGTFDGDYYDSGETHNGYPVYTAGAGKFLYWSTAPSGGGSPAWALGATVGGATVYLSHSNDTGGYHALPDAPWKQVGGIYVPTVAAYSGSAAVERYPFYKYEGGAWTELTGPPQLVAEEATDGATAEWWRRAQAYNLGDGRLAFAGWVFKWVRDGVTDTLTVRRLVRVYDTGSGGWLDYDDAGHESIIEIADGWQGATAGWTQVARAADGKLWMVPFIAWLTDTEAIRTWNPSTTLFAAVSDASPRMAWYYDDPGYIVYGDFGFACFIGSTLYHSVPGSGYDGYLRSWNGSSWVITGYVGERVGPTWGTWPSNTYLTPYDERMGWTFTHNGDQGTPAAYAAYAKPGLTMDNPAGFAVVRFTSTTKEALEDFPDVTPDAGAINLYVGTRIYVTCKNGVYYYNDGTAEPAAVSITTPAEGVTIGRTVTVTGTYSGFTPGATAEACLHIGGEWHLTHVTISGTGAGLLSITWTIPETVPDGSVALELILGQMDGSGISASHTHTVTLGTGGGGGGVNPTIVFLTPEEGDTVSGLVTVIVLASDDSAVAQVSLLVDGSAVGLPLVVANDGTNRYRWVLNTKDMLNGPHTLTAEATDDEGLTATAEVNVTLANAEADLEEVFFTVPCGVDENGAPVTAGTSTIRPGPWARGIAAMMLQPEADLPTNPALRRNVWVGVHVPGNSVDFAQYTLVDLDREFSFPAGTLCFRGGVRALRQQTVAYWDLQATAGLAFATASNGDPLILAGTPYKVLRFSLQTGTLSLLKDLSALETAPTHIAAGSGKVYVNSGARLVVLDEDSGDLTFRGTVGFPDELTEVSALASNGDSVYLAGVMGDGSFVLIDFTFDAPRLLATPAARVEILRWAGGKLYGGDTAGKVFSLTGAAWAEVADTGAAHVTGFGAQASNVFAGTGDDGVLWTSVGGWQAEHDFAFTAVKGLAEFRGYPYAGGTGAGGNILWYRNDSSMWVQTVVLEEAAVAGVNALMAVTPSSGAEQLFVLTTGTGGELGYNGRLYRVEVAPDAGIVCGPKIPDLAFAVTGD